MYRFFCKVVSGITMMLMVITAHAMTIVRHGDNLEMYGQVIPADLISFRNESEKAPVRQIVLGQSHGGDLRAAYGIASMIRKQHLNTAVKGFCISSCAIIFMAGEKRQFADGQYYRKAMLGFHSPHHKETKQVSESGIPKLRSYLLNASNGKFPAVLLDKALHIQNAQDVLIFYYPEAEKQSVWFCPAGARPRPKACEKVEGDALGSGVITTLERLDLSFANDE